MDKESLTEKLLDLVEGRETPESWRNWWDEHETELEALLSRGEFLKLKPCRHGFQWVPVFGSQKRAIAILEKSGTAFEASNLYQERYLAELDAEIAPDWDLPTEAVQSGLNTLRSHLELVQGDAALLYEMT